LAAHNALTEWWYVTGHVQAEDGRQFGFEFTVFQLRRENSCAERTAQRVYSLISR
jgi:predicted secreted hydrolase